MILRKWEDIPQSIRLPEVKPYFEVLSKKKAALVLKRVFDVVVASILFVVLLPAYLIIGCAIVLDTRGPVLFKQIRVTTYGREFKIWKFRTMVDGADKGSGQLTTKGDMRVTRVGKLLRGGRLDELPQLVNIILGDMSFVGTRPEVPRYVNQYKPEMYATLLLPAGVTSEASILYKDEEKLLENATDAGKVYVEEVLPGKMYYNLKSIKNFSVWRELGTMVRTVLAVCGKEYVGDY